MTNFEFWIDIVIILLLIPSIFYSALLSAKIGKIQKSQDKMTELAQALRQCTEAYNAAQPQKPAPKPLAEEPCPTEQEQEPVPAESTPARAEPQQPANQAPKELSEAELELLQAIQSIK